MGIEDKVEGCNQVIFDKYYICPYGEIDCPYQLNKTATISGVKYMTCDMKKYEKNKTFK